MSKLMYLAASGAFALAAFMAAPADAQQVSRTTAGRGPAVAVRPGEVTPVRPNLADRVRIRPRGDLERRRHDPERRRHPDHLQQRLRNACFGSPNPPSQICRRYYGEGGPGAPRAN